MASNGRKPTTHHVRPDTHPGLEPGLFFSGAGNITPMLFLPRSPRPSIGAVQQNATLKPPLNEKPVNVLTGFSQAKPQRQRWPVAASSSRREFCQALNNCQPTKAPPAIFKSLERLPPRMIMADNDELTMG